MKSITFLLAIASSTTTWQGFQKMLQFNPEGDWLSILWAIVSGLAIATLWLKLFEWYPNATDEAKKKMGMSIPFMLIFIFLVSTYFSVIGLGGDDAELAHMQKGVIRAENSLQNANKEISGNKGLITAFGVFATQMEALANSEKLGGLTEKSGIGPVVRQLKIFQITFSGLGRTLTESVESQEASVEEAREITNSLRETLGDLQIPLSRKKEIFGEKSSKINELFERIKGANINGLLINLVKEIENLSPSDNTSAEAVQEAVLTKIFSLILDAKRILTKELEARKHESKDFELLYPMNVSVAIWRYCFQIPGAWGGGLGFDYLPLLFFFWINWTREEKEVEV